MFAKLKHILSPEGAKSPKKDPVTNGDGGASMYLRLEAERLRKKEEPDQPSPTQVSATKATPPTSSVVAKVESTVAAQSARVRQKRLMKEFSDIQKCSAVRDGVFCVTLVEDNLFEWDVKIYTFDSDSELAMDLYHLKAAYGVDNVWLRMSFPDNYPFSPPFVRVVAPLVQGGYVLSGGAICMELLTTEGWSQAYTTEAVVMQTIVTIVKGKARIVASVKKEFSEDEARKSYDYLVKTHAKHGWNTPPQSEG